MMRRSSRSIVRNRGGSWAASSSRSGSHRDLPGPLALSTHRPSSDPAFSKPCDRTGQGSAVQKLWVDFFSDPSQWWDHRQLKVNPRYPDFKHKRTNQSLWLNSTTVPPWVEAELALISPGTLQLSSFSWNKMLSKHFQAGEYRLTIGLYHQMLQEGMPPDKFTFVPVLNACSKLGDLEEGRCIHQHAVKHGCELDVFVGSSLVYMYSKCGSIEHARKVFDKMPTCDGVAWNTMILGYVKCGHGNEALAMYRKMCLKGVETSIFTFVAVLNACASVGNLEEGRHVHKQIIERGCESDAFVQCSLVDMYAKCGSIEDALIVFNKISLQSVVSWNAIILGLVKSGQGHRALQLYEQMQQEAVDPDPVTFIGVLNACAKVGALEQGRLVHKEIARKGFQSNLFVCSSLVDMYAKCGNTEEAWEIFNMMATRDVVSWNAMILGYSRCSQGRKALELSQQMQAEGLEPDPVTFVGMVNACASIGALKEGRLIHQQIIDCNFESEIFVGNSLVDMYAKCGSIQDAWIVFDRIPKRTVVSWNSILSGYVKCGQGQRALELSQQMLDEGVQPDPVTFVSLLNACASVGALEEGRRFHHQIMECSHGSDVFVCNSLIDMYVKCGSLEDGLKVFDKMPTHNGVSWNAVLGGCALHGHAKNAVYYSEKMSQSGVNMDEITFLSLLSACSHGGLVDEGLHYIEMMSVIHCITPTVEHYSSIVDLLGRAGRVHEAEDLIQSMFCGPDSTMWMCLLGACKVHGNVEIGERASKQVLELDPESSGGYVLLSNMYAAAGKWG